MVAAKIGRGFGQGVEILNAAGDVERIDVFPALEVLYLDDAGAELWRAVYTIREGTSIQTMDDVHELVARDLAALGRRTAPRVEKAPDPNAVAARVAEWESKRGEPVDALATATPAPSESDIA